MAVADDLDRATDSKVRIFPLYEEYAQKTDRMIPIVLLTPQD